MFRSQQKHLGAPFLFYVICACFCTDKEVQITQFQNKRIGWRCCTFSNIVKIKEDNSTQTCWNTRKSIHSVRMGIVLTIKQPHQSSGLYLVPNNPYRRR